jgi:excisionase family DNA binding protein
MTGQNQQNRRRAEAPDRFIGGGRRRRIQFFTIPETASMASVSSRTVRRWIASGELVAHRFGAAVRIADGDLSAFFATHRES